MKSKKYLLILMASLLLSACSKNERPNISKPSSISEDETKKMLDKSKEFLNKDTIEKFKDIKDSNEKLNLLSLEIFTDMLKVQSKSQNFILSPYSIQSVLKSISENITDKKDLSFLEFYDGINLEKNFENTKADDLILVNSEKVKGNNDKEKIKFVKFPNEAMDKYKNFQKNLFGEDIDNTPFKEENILSIINGIMFNGKWDKPFDINLTNEDEFKTSSGEVVKVPTMFQSFSNANGIANDEVEAFSMNAQSSKVYFIKFKNNSDVDAEKINNVMKNLDNNGEKKTVEFSVPKLNTSTKTDIKSVFNILKIPSMLSKFKMDKITKDNIKIDKAFQVSSLILDEKSAKAKSVTRIDGEKLAAKPDDNLLAISMDSPFFVIIKDKAKNSDKENIVFTSYIENPKK